MTENIQSLEEAKVAYHERFNESYRSGFTERERTALFTAVAKEYGLGVKALRNYVMCNALDVDFTDFEERMSALEVERAEAERRRAEEKEQMRKLEQRLIESMVS